MAKYLHMILLFGALAVTMGGCAPGSMPETAPPATPTLPETPAPASTAPPPAATATRPLPTVTPVQPTAEPTLHIPVTPRIRWSHTDATGQCREARLYLDEIESGPCQGALASYPLSRPLQAELEQLLGSYDTFEAETEAGHIIFRARRQPGMAAPVPSPPIQRMLAIWTWAAVVETETGQPPEWNHVLSWQSQERCRMVNVYLSGRLEAFRCLGDEWIEVGRTFLATEQAAQLYAWYDQLGTVATPTLHFHGRGRESAEDASALDRFALSHFLTLELTVTGTAAAPVEPLITAAYVHFDSWSADGRWLAAWLSSQEDLDAWLPYTMPGGVLHFVEVATGEMCPAPQFHRESSLSGGVQWPGDGQAVVVIEGEAFAGRPCQVEPFDPLPGTTVAAGAAPDPGLSPGGRYRAHSSDIYRDDGRLDVVTTITGSEGQEILAVSWQHRGGKGDLGLGGAWLNSSQFLIYETWDDGPLLLDVAQQLVTPVVTGLLDLESIPNLERDQYSLRARPASGAEPESYYLVIQAISWGGEPPPIMLYHSATGQVETLPYRQVWGFSPDYEWLFLHEEVRTVPLPGGGRNVGYHLWGRRLADVTGGWQLIAPAVNTLLWREAQPEIAFRQNETTLIWQSFPKGHLIGQWHTGPYGASPTAFSPDGRYLIAVGNRPGAWNYGLFLLPRP
jgi:hypothetical protein